VSYKIPAPQGPINIDDSSADSVPIPGAGVTVGGDSGKLKTRHAGGGTVSHGPNGVTVSGASYNVATSAGDCDITPNGAALTLGKASHSVLHVGALTVRVSAAAPGIDSVGAKGDLWVATGTGVVGLYQCAAIIAGVDPDPDTYTWKQFDVVSD
jgi:hypothetical protein